MRIPVQCQVVLAPAHRMSPADSSLCLQCPMTIYHIIYHSISKPEGGQPNRRVYAAAGVAGAGELTRLGFSPAGLLSLPILLLLLPLLKSWEVACWPSAEDPKALALGVRHDGTSQSLPVNDLILNPVFCHFRHGFVVRSRARNFSLMTPWLAFGPSLCEAAE